MSLILSGTDGLSDVDGSAATPAIRGTDANTGIFFPAADTIAFSEGGAEAMRIDSDGDVGIGTSSPGQRLEVANSSTNTTFSTVGNQLLIRNSGSTANAFARIDFTGSTNNPMASIAASFENYGTGATNLIFGNTNTGTGAIAERMRIDSSGNLLVGTTSTIGSATGILQVKGAASQNAMQVQIGTNGNNGILWYNASASAIGSIVVNSGSVAYNTTSDYRLKENVAPMTGALEKITALKPCTYTWKADGSEGQGFIAHELQAIVPDCVSGEKDAVDADGNPKYQGIDTSFLVATLTAALQEAHGLIKDLQSRVDALEAK